jgi:hypothetical protein
MKDGVRFVVKAAQADKLLPGFRRCVYAETRATLFLTSLTRAVWMQFRIAKS